jgi:hypothetical protein
LQKLPRSTATGRLKDLALAQRRWGRLQQPYWRTAWAFEVQITALDPPQGKENLKIAYNRHTQWDDWAALSEGCCLLRTNLTGVEASTLWKRYLQLTEAEWAFRITKDELVIRPTHPPQGDQAPAPQRGVRLRCVTAPDEAQKVLLHRLSLTLPQRLRRIDELIPM